MSNRLFVLVMMLGAALLVRVMLVSGRSSTATTNQHTPELTTRVGDYWLPSIPLTSKPASRAQGFPVNVVTNEFPFDDGSRSNDRWRVEQGHLPMTDHQGEVSILNRIYETGESRSP